MQVCLLKSKLEAFHASTKLPTVVILFFLIRCSRFLSSLRGIFLLICIVVFCICVFCSNDLNNFALLLVPLHGPDANVESMMFRSQNVGAKTCSELGWNIQVWHFCFCIKGEGGGKGEGKKGVD